MVANLIIGVAIAFLPLYVKVFSFDFLRDSRDLLFISLAAFIIILLQYPRRIVPRYWYAIPSWVLLNYMFYQYTTSQSGIFIAHNVNIAVIGCLFFKYFQCHEIRGRQHIFDGMMIGAFIQGFLAISGYFGNHYYYDLFAHIYPDFKIPFSNDSGSGVATGSFGHNNILASYLCMTIPAYFTRKKLLPLALVPLAGLIATQAWMGIAPLFAGAFYYLIVIKWKIITKAKIYLAAISGMIVIPFFDIGVDSGRFFVWRTIIRSATIKHWLIGEGVGWYPDHPIYWGADMVQEHNAYLTIFNSYGLVGFLLLAPIFIKFLKHRDSSDMLSTIVFIIFCNSWGHFTLHQSTVLIIIVPMLCIALADVYCKSYR